MSEDRNARNLGDLVVAYTDYNCARWSKDLPPPQQHSIESYFSNLQYLARNTASIEREPAKLEAFKKSLNATVTHQVHDADPPRAEVSGLIGGIGLVGGIASGIATAYQFITTRTFPIDYGIGALLCAGIGSYLAHRAYKACQVKHHADNYRALAGAEPRVWTAAFTYRSKQISEALGRFAERNFIMRAQGTRPAA
jgi:hypothetical protein